MYSLRPKPDSDDQCPSGTKYVACLTPNGKMFSCDFSTGYNGKNVACGAPNLAECPGDTSEFSMCDKPVIDTGKTVEKTNYFPILLVLFNIIALVFIYKQIKK